MNIEQERAQFEAWYRLHHGSRNVYGRDASGEYADKQVQGAFNVWQARAALTAQPAASAEPRSIGYIDYKGAHGHARAVLTRGMDEQGNDWADGTKIYAAPVAAQAPQDERMETTSEHIARDIREGRFPQRSEPQRVQATEWGPMPDAGVEADAHVAVIEGDEAVRVLRWNSDVGAFSYPVGTRLYAAQAPAASAQPVLRIYAEGSMRSVTEWLDGARDLPDGDHTLYAAPIAAQASAVVNQQLTTEQAPAADGDAQPVAAQETYPQMMPAELSQFLSDVMTAAGLVSHGKQCKALGERLGDACMRLRLHYQELFAAPVAAQPSGSCNGMPAYEGPLSAAPAAANGDARRHYAGVTVWIGDIKCTNIVSKEALELSNIDELSRSFEVARQYIDAARSTPATEKGE